MDQSGPSSRLNEWPLALDPRPISSYYDFMNITDPSFVAQELLKVLSQLESDSTRAIQRMDYLRNSDSEFGYASATGYALGTLSNIQITAKSYLNVYLDA